jgi:hypothetical protein
MSRFWEISLSLLKFYFLSANIWQNEGESCRRGNLLILIKAFRPMRSLRVGAHRFGFPFGRRLSIRR